MYVCFGRQWGALFELLDVVLTAGSYPSLPDVSLASWHRRPGDGVREGGDDERK